MLVPSVSAGGEVDAALEADRKAGAEEPARPVARGVGVAQRLEQPARTQPIVCDGFDRCAHPAAGKADAAERGLDLERRPCRRPGLDGGVDVACARRARALIRELRVEVVATEERAEPGELRVVRARDGDPPVRAAIRIDGRAAWIRVAGSHGQTGGGVVIHGLVPDERREHVEHGDVDELSATAGVALAKRREHSERGERRRRVVGDRDPRPQGWTVGSARLGHQARARLHDVVHRRATGVLAALAGDRAVHEPGMQPGERLVPETEALHRARLRVVDEDIAAPDDGAQHALPVGMGDVERDAALAAIALEERDREHVVADTPW